jgi:Fur family iron response transcriptional regulator
VVRRGQPTRFGRRKPRAIEIGIAIVTSDEGAPCGEVEIRDKLVAAGLRPTRQRMVLGTLLFGQGDRHVSAEALHGEVVASGESVSLATVYNTLHQFKQAGLLRELAIEGSKAYFDTNISNHNHFYVEAEGRLMDIPAPGLRVDGIPAPPEGFRISHVDVVIRLVKE